MEAISNDVRVTVRIDKNLKASAENLFERLGLNMTTAFNVFLRKAVEENAIPFAVSTKSSGFGNGYSTADVSRAFNSAVEDIIEKNRNNNMPIARYDLKTRRAYLENADGTKDYINE
jgi:DNA-damage-inducible protein J